MTPIARWWKAADARRMIAIGLLALTVGLVGCSTVQEGSTPVAPLVGDTEEGTTGTSAGDAPDQAVDTDTDAAVFEREDVARTLDRSKDPAVVCHWASNKYVTIVVSINAALNGHGNHENDVIFFYTEDETLCDDLLPPESTTTTTAAPPESSTTSSLASTTSTTDPSATSTTSTTDPPASTTSTSTSTSTSTTTSSTTSTTDPSATTTSTTAATTTTTSTTSTTVDPTTTTSSSTAPGTSTTSTTDPSTTTSSSTAPGGSTTTTDPAATSTSTTDPAATSTTEATDVGNEELPHTGLEVPAWLLALIGGGMILSGSGLVRWSREHGRSGDSL